MLLILTLVAVGLVIVVHWRASAREAAANAAYPPIGELIDIDGVNVHANDVPLLACEDLPLAAELALPALHLNVQLLFEDNEYEQLTEEACQAIAPIH